MYDPTVARLTYRALLGRRRAAILFVLPALLLLIAADVRMFAGADDQIASNVLGGFAIATMVPLIGVIAGTGAIGPEIDDGSIVYLIAKPVPRRTVVLSKYVVAWLATLALGALPLLVAGLVALGVLLPLFGLSVLVVLLLDRLVVRRVPGLAAWFDAA